jgi:hypothetical protein
MRLCAVILLSLIGTMVFSSCDKVDDPYEHLPQIGDCRIDSNDLVFASNDTSNIIRKLLVEEYTGIKCGNCPDMARVLKTLLENEDDVILVAIQAGCSNLSHTDAKHPIDLRGDESDIYCKEISNGDVIPYSLVNYKADAGKAATAEVDEMVSDLLNDNAWKEPIFKLAIKTSYYPECRLLSIENKAEALVDYSGSFGVISYLVENDIVAPQTDYKYREDPDRLKKDYEHDHTLRKAIPSAWGVTLAESASTGERFSNFTQYEVPENYLVQNCEIVSLIYDIDTKEILQVDVVTDFAK